MSFVVSDVVSKHEAAPGVGAGLAARPPAPCVPADGEALDVTLANDVSLVESVVAAVVARCAAAGYAPRVCHLNVPVALSEALANAMLSGNAGSPSKLVRLRACVDPHAIVLEVTDQGTGFDLDACAARGDESDFLEREGGRGLFLMRRLMERVELYRSPAGGSVVRMTLRRA